MSLMKKPTILIFAILMSVFFVFATTKNNAASKVITASAVKPVTTENSENASALFSELHLTEAGLNQAVFNSALQGLHKLDEEGAIPKDDIITIVDFSQPSSQKRLYVLDLENKRILFNTLVAHGRNSGTLWTKSFSNQASSLKSSPGFYVTEDTYVGSNGYSLRLNGLEKNINDNAMNRAIVIHAGIRLPHVAHQREQQGERVFGDRRRVFGAGRGDHDATLRRRREIHRIDAHAVAGDDAKLRRMLKRSGYLGLNSAYTGSIFDWNAL